MTNAFIELAALAVAVLVTPFIMLGGFMLGIYYKIKNSMVSWKKKN